MSKPETQRNLDQAERHVTGGDEAKALRVLDTVYLDVQPTHDLASVRRAIAILAGIEESAIGQGNRKARRLRSEFAELERSYASQEARDTVASGEGGGGQVPGGSPLAAHASADGRRAYPGWIDTVVGCLWVFLVFELIAGVIVAVATDRTAYRVVAIGVAVFWATMISSIIAVIVLLERILETAIRQSSPDA